MKKILLLLLVTVGIICVFCSCSGETDVGVSDEMYIGCAKQIVSKSLKNPSSLQVHDAYVYEKDDYGSAIVCMDITSQNSYGGADRDIVYVCVMHLESDGSFEYSKTVSYTENELNIGALKNINGFGKPKE